MDKLFYQRTPHQKFMVYDDVCNELMGRPRAYHSEKQNFERGCVDNPRAAPRTADPLWGAIILEENVPWR